MLNDGITSATLGELMLVLMFVILILFYVVPSRSDNSEDLQTILQNKEVELERLRTSLKDYQAKTTEYEEALARKDLKSKQKPTCKEIGKSDGFLATVLIKESNCFEIEGKEYTFNELMENFQSDLELAYRFNCNHCVRVMMSEDLSLRDFDAGKSKLEKLFYTTRAGFK